MRTLQLNRQREYFDDKIAVSLVSHSFQRNFCHVMREKFKVPFIVVFLKYSETSFYLP